MASGHRNNVRWNCEGGGRGGGEEDGGDIRIPLLVEVSMGKCWCVPNSAYIRVIVDEIVAIHNKHWSNRNFELERHFLSRKMSMLFEAVSSPSPPLEGVGT